MQDHSTGHDQYSREAFINYLNEYFGEEADTYLLSRNQQQELFGQIVRLILATRKLPQAPTDEKRPGSRWTQPSLIEAPGESRTSGTLSGGEALKGDDAATGVNSKGMSQNELAAAMQHAWWHLNHERRLFDARWVRRLLDGDVILDRPLVLCLAYTLRAEAKEIAILLEAAGYNGWNAYKAYRLKAPRSTIIGWLEEGADNHRSKRFAPADILTLIKFRMEAEIRDALPTGATEQPDDGDR